MFDDIIMNMIKNKVLGFHVEGVDSYLKKTEKKNICGGGHFNTFTGIKALMKVLMFYVRISMLKG